MILHIVLAFRDYVLAKAKRHEQIAISVVKFALELNPMQPETMQKAFESVHQKQHEYSDIRKSNPHYAS